MASSAFRFKQFSVAHDKCAMKVNTDGVLLGAWVDAGDAKTILDIGTGTGVIALILAQENSGAVIDAIDIDENAYQQAKENFEQSDWSNRLNASHSSIQSFSSDKKYDVIVSNPPYFINDLKGALEQKNIAKHTVSLNYEELITGIKNFLAVDGRVFLVIPSFNFLLIESIAKQHQLFVTAKTEVIAVGGKEHYICLIQLERSEKNFTSDSLTIQNAEGDFTEQYKDLTKEFYLKF